MRKSRSGRPGKFMLASIRLPLMLGCLLIGACDIQRDSRIHAETPETTLPGVYAGLFPCDGCPGIPTTLWLRPDGRFFVEQKYPAVDDRAAMDAYNLGRWRWIADDEVMLLEGAGPVRIYTRKDRDTLEMRTASDLEHSLTRNPSAPGFSATIRLAGMMRVQGKGASFNECLTGYAVPVGSGGDYARFLHQYRSASVGGAPVFVELDGRFAWSDGGAPSSLTIERFVTVKADGAC